MTAFHLKFTYLSPNWGDRCIFERTRSQLSELSVSKFFCWGHQCYYAWSLWLSFESRKVFVFKNNNKYQKSKYRNVKAVKLLFCLSLAYGTCLLDFSPFMLSIWSTCVFSPPHKFKRRVVEMFPIGFWILKNGTSIDSLLFTGKSL